MRILADGCVEALAGALANAPDAADALAAVNDAITRLQALLSRPGGSAPAAEPAARPRTPERVERDADTVSLFGDFLQESGEGLSRADQS